MKRKILFIIMMICILSKLDVYAATTYKGKIYEEWYPNSGFTVFAEESNRNLDYNSWMIKSTIDNRIYYCIEPGAPLETSYEGSHTYYTTKKEITENSNLTEEKYKKINLIAFYGYGYENNEVNHKDKKWYGITQVMIWRIMRPDITWTFKENRNAKPDNNLFKKEVDEINKLVNSHEEKPSFLGKNNTITLLVDKETEFKDTNNVLQKYKIYTENTNIDYRIEGNKLIAYAPKKVPNSASNLVIKSQTNENYALLSSKDFQDVIISGEPINKYLNIVFQVTGGTINLQKIDQTTEKNKPQGDASLEGAIYNIYNKDNKIVESIKTDKEGTAKTSLAYGDYTIKEEKPSEGYNLDTNKYDFSISEQNDEINIISKEKVIYGKLKLFKQKGGPNEPLTPEQNAKFEIINSNNEIVEELETNENGLAIEKIPYGVYKIHQTKGEEGYEKIEDIKIEIKENKIYEINIKNLKKSTLEITKKDKNTLKPINDVTYELYKINNNEEEFIKRAKTDDKGKITIEDLEIGSYFIIEKETKKMYKLDTEKKYIQVKENGQKIKVNLLNERKRGNLKFIKTNSNGNKKLSNAVIELEFLETKTKIFKKKTNKNGEINKSNLIAGKYCLKEIKAPKGYVKYPKKVCFEIKDENEKVIIYMKNKEIKEYYLPDTYKERKSLLPVLIVITIFGGRLAYKKKFKNN